MHRIHAYVVVAQKLVEEWIPGGRTRGLAVPNAQDAVAGCRARPPDRRSISALQLFNLSHARPRAASYFHVHAYVHARMRSYI